MFPVGTLVRKSSNHSQRGIVAGMNSENHRTLVMTKDQNGQDSVEILDKMWEICFENGLGANDVMWLVSESYTGPVKIVYVSSEKGAGVCCTALDKVNQNSIWASSKFLFTIDEAEELFLDFQDYFTNILHNTCDQLKAIQQMKKESNGTDS